MGEWPEPFGRLALLARLAGAVAGEEVVEVVALHAEVTLGRQPFRKNIQNGHTRWPTVKERP